MSAFAQLALARERIAEAKAAGVKPDLRTVFAPGTLEVALEAEQDDDYHVEFRDGRPVWIEGPRRFVGGEEVDRG